MNLNYTPKSVISMSMAYLISLCIPCLTYFGMTPVALPVVSRHRAVYMSTCLTLYSQGVLYGSYTLYIQLRLLWDMCVQ